MLLVIFGATGPVGRALIEQASKLGHEVVAVVVGDADASALPDGVRVERVSKITADRVATLTHGADAVLSAIAPDPSLAEPLVTRTSAAIAEGMERAGAERLVTVGTAELCPGDAPAAMSAAAKADQLGGFRALEASTRQWTVICPPRIEAGPATGLYREVVEGFPPDGTIIRAGDVAHAALRAVARDELVHQRVGIAT